MTIHWQFALPGLVLLFCPLPLFNGKKTKYRELSREWHSVLPQIFSLGWHWADFVRAWAGTWLLKLALEILPDTMGASPMIALGTVLFVALTLTTLICREEGAVNAPFTFLAGMVLGVFPPLVAVFALVSAALTGIGSSFLSSFFVLLPVAIGVLGYYFVPNLVLVGVGATLSFLPLLLSMMFRRDMVIAHVARKSSPDDHSPLR